MSTYNVWLPSNEFYDFNDGVTTSLGNKPVSTSTSILCKTFVIPNNKAGFGIVAESISPAFNITKPPKVMYCSTADMIFMIKDSDGWLWQAPCPKQTLVAERGWELGQFSLNSTQTNTGNLPDAPSTGAIQLFQFIGAEGVFGTNNTTSQSISIAYVAGRSPTSVTSGDIRRVTITDTSPLAHTLKIGDVSLANGTRREIKYLGALPFGLQINGPHNRLSVLPYRGPIIAGYQSATPWIMLKDNASLAQMLQFMADSQTQFTNRNPDRISGPFMHAYLPAVWDCEQNGTLDTWIWEGPDGNPTWDGWQYRALDSMARSWLLATKTSDITSANISLLKSITTKFLDWLYSWLQTYDISLGVPDDWKPVNWVSGQTMTPNMYLEPKYTTVSGHDNALVLKAAVNAANAGYDIDRAKYIIHRVILALKSIQVVDETNTNIMRGAFTANPSGYEVYGFEHGEILEALSIAMQSSYLLSHS